MRYIHRVLLCVPIKIIVILYYILYNAVELCSNLGWYTVYPKWNLLWFQLLPPDKCRDITPIGHDHFLQNNIQFYVGRSLWREGGSVVYNYCWPLPAQSFLGPSPMGLFKIRDFFVSSSPTTRRSRWRYSIPPPNFGSQLAPPLTLVGQSFPWEHVCLRRRYWVTLVYIWLRRGRWPATGLHDSTLSVLASSSSLGAGCPDWGLFIGMISSLGHGCFKIIYNLPVIGHPSVPCCMILLLTP
jgi:hypothetical protein